MTREEHLLGLLRAANQRIEALEEALQMGKASLDQRTVVTMAFGPERGPDAAAYPFANLTGGSHD